MLVKFKLSPDQLVRALEEEARVASGCEDVDFNDPDVCWGGTLIGALYGHQNLAQHMELDSSASTLIYHGDRYPLLCDGGLETLRLIAGAEGLEALHVVEYTTTMPEMAWYETREDLALRQVAACETLAEAARVVGTNPKNWYYQWQTTAARAALQRFPGPACAVPGTLEYRRLVASGEVENARLRSQLQAMLD